MIERKIFPGKYYRHFRGNIYKVIGIATHTETDEPLVIYQSQYGDFRLFARPLSMFAEEIDLKKYPESQQKFRFELIDDSGI